MAVAAVVALLMTVAPGAIGVAAAATEVGLPGPSYAGAYLEPSASKPQSKLWHHGGFWFGVLFHSASGTFRIHRLDPANPQWTDTGVVVDNRMNSRSDVRLVGDHLYIASHRYSKTSGSGNYPARLMRYSYDAGAQRWTLDAGFPTQINSIKSETLVIDVDSTGRVWATWTQSNKVWMNRTIGDDRSWGTPFVLPTTTTIQSDDIASVVAFGGSSIGVLWGDQTTDHYWFSVHTDGAPDTAWAPAETALGGAGMADDHLSVKAAADGRLFAVVKTGKMGDDDPLIVLAVRDTNGGWTNTTVATERYSHTRPIVVLDETNRDVHVLMTGPQLPAISGQKGGDIYLKSADMDAPSFVDGYGQVVMHADGASDLNNATSTEQAVSGTTGLLAVASSETLERYWSALLPLGDTPPPPPPPPAPPVASFVANPSSGVAPVEVAFRDTSSGSPTSWSWDLGDGTTSNVQHPTHVYANAGSYTVVLTAANAGGSSSATATITVTSPPPPPPPGTTVTLTAVADAYVSSSSPTTNAGTSAFLRAGTGSASYRSFIRFDVPSSSASVTRAVLRLYGASNVADGGAIAGAPDTWTESGVTWSNAPVPGATIAAVGKLTNGAWVEIDVTSLITSSGSRTIAITGGSSTSAWYSSRQGANPPQLVLTTG